ncbi:MAG: toxin-antitoxin system HicB family antitoxin [Armatimonadetes bacterium]|nr:toxin-antitoxin system HicB family antitoxin [Armatimonadota bacterium]
MDRALDHYLALDYPVEIKRVDESLGGGYLACIPCLGSQAFVGDGDTPQEAYENLMSAKAEIFEDYLKSGLSIPEPPNTSAYDDYSGKLVLRMPRDLHARLSLAAKANDTSLNQFIVYALSRFEAKWDVLADIKALWERPDNYWDVSSVSTTSSEKRFSDWNRGETYERETA